MMAIEPEGKTLWCLQAQAQRGQQLALGRVDHVEVPRQQVDLQFGSALGQGGQKGPNLSRQAALLLVVEKIFVAVEIPTQNQNLLARVLAGLGKGGKVVRGIHNDSRALAGLNTPAITPCLKDRGLG